MPPAGPEWTAVCRSIEDMHIKQLDSLERSYFTPTTRHLLCHFAAGELQRPLPELPAVDWEEVFQAICSHGVLGLTQRYLHQQQTHTAYPPPDFCQRIQQAHRLNVMRMVVRQGKVRRVLQHLLEASSSFMVIKGPAIAYGIYPDAVLRAYNDLDILVRTRDWTSMHQILLGMGCIPAEDQPHPPPALIPGDIPYEQKYWQPDMALLIEVHYDDILNAGLAARDSKGFWQRSLLMDIDGLAIRVMSLEDQLVHLCAHAHYHGYTRLNWLSDIALIVRDHAARLNWQHVVQIVRTEEAHVPVYFSLLFLEQVLGVGVPGGVLVALRPDPMRRWWHEHYLPAKQVIALQPMWRPDFSFYFRPLFKRLLPDLLVMGRRRDKLRYLVQLCYPSQAWLRHYYHLGDSEWIGMHYLLHPLKLIYHYMAEMKSRT